MCIRDRCMGPGDLQSDVEVAPVTAFLRQPVANGIMPLTHSSSIGTSHCMNASIIQRLFANVPHSVDLLTLPRRRGWCGKVRVR
eukprot:12799894-Prorocentrum_lima.AAC.1